MNKRELNRKRKHIRKQYRIQGAAVYAKPSKNKIVIHHQNSIEHEVAKAKICYYLRDDGQYFITEAQHRKTKRRHDVVSLDTDIKYEVETDPKRAERFEGDEDVVVIKLWKGEPDYEKLIEHA